MARWEQGTGEVGRGLSRPMRRFCVRPSWFRCRGGGVALGCLTAMLVSCAPPSSETDGPPTMTVLIDGFDLSELRRYEPKFLLFLPLVDRYGPEIRPRLAESWEHSSDYRSWTYHLRRDVRWHDGVPVTAHDVAFSIELFSHPDVLFLARVWDVDSLAVPDDHTITLYFARPLPYGVGSWPVFFPSHLLEDLDPGRFYEWDFWERPVGNGPYRFVRRVPETMVELEANRDFYAGAPSIPRVVLRFGGSSRIVELAGGGVDVTSALPPADLLTLDADPRFVVHYVYNWSTLQAIYWNQEHPFLGDPIVRRALSQAIDRRGVARAIGYPDEMPLVGGISDEDLVDTPYTQGGWDQGPPFDVTEATRLLDRSGWIDRDGDGIREKGSDQARFTLLVARSGLMPGETMGILVREQLRDVGVLVDLSPTELATATEAVETGRFEAAIGMVDNTPTGILYGWLEGSPFGYHDEEAERLLTALVQGVVSLDEQSPLYARINEIFQRDVPVTFLFPMVDNYVTHRRIRGLNDRRAGLFGVAERLSIEEAPR